MTWSWDGETTDTGLCSRRWDGPPRGSHSATIAFLVRFKTNRHAQFNRKRIKSDLGSHVGSHGRYRTRDQSDTPGHSRTWSIIVSAIGPIGRGSADLHAGSPRQRPLYYFRWSVERETPRLVLQTHWDGLERLSSSSDKHDWIFPLGFPIGFGDWVSKSTTYLESQDSLLI